MYIYKYVTFKLWLEVHLCPSIEYITAFFFFYQDFPVFSSIHISINYEHSVPTEEGHYSATTVFLNGNIPFQGEVQFEHGVKKPIG